MTNNEGNTALATTDKPDAPAEWGTRGEIAAFGQRIKTMLPGGDKLTDAQAMALGQYSMVMDLNPFRGEVYGFPGRGGQLCIVDSYKALVRWAKNECPYVDKYEPLPLEDNHAHHFRCWILRDDRKGEIQDWVNMGAPWRDAFEMVAVFSDGNVTKHETGKQPPAGWTWEQVARKRALKNALNLSHGAPSPKELAAMSWDVNGVTTIPEDWDTSTAMSRQEVERLAELRAQDRDHKSAWDQLTGEEQQAQFEQNVTAMRGPADFEGFDTPPTPPSNGPEWTAPAVEAGEDEPLQAAMELDSETPTKPDDLLDAANAATDGYYNHPAHLLNGIRAHLGDEWRWPVNDPAAYAEALQVAIDHAKANQS